MSIRSYIPGLRLGGRAPLAETFDHTDSYSPHMGPRAAAAARRQSRETNNDAAYTDAQTRVYKIIDGLSLLLGESRQLTKIDLLEPLPEHNQWFNRNPLLTSYKPPADSISLSEYAFDKPPRKLETHYRLPEGEMPEIPGVVVPYVLGGKKAFTKEIPIQAREHHLIVPLDGTYRSWIGGILAHDAVSLKEGILKGDMPSQIATGDTIVNTFHEGDHGSRAIEGMTAVHHRNDLPHRINELWRIGNGLIGVGGELDIADVDARTGPLMDHLGGPDHPHRQKQPPPGTFSLP